MEAVTVLGSKHFEFVIEHRFVCLTHSEAKQTNVRVWSRERFTVGPTKESGWLRFKTPELPSDFGGKASVGKIWGESYRLCCFLDWLVVR